MNTNETFDEWGILEVMGHQRYAGRITSQVVAGTGFVRIDVPAVGDRKAFTKLFGTSSIYGITPTSEDVARRVACSLYLEPVNRFELNLPKEKQLTYLDEDERDQW